MSIDRLIKAQQEENEEIVATILSDGSNATAEYTIEHHFSSNNFDRLEKAAVDAFKVGFEVSHAEEMELDDGSVIFCFDAVAHHLLDVDLLDKACEALLQLAVKQQVDYDGWGTYFIDENGEEIREDDFEEEDKQPLH